MQKLKIQKERLQSAEFGEQKFNKINSEIQRLTTSYQTHSSVATTKAHFCLLKTSRNVR